MNNQPLIVIRDLGNKDFGYIELTYKDKVIKLSVPKVLLDYPNVDVVRILNFKRIIEEKYKKIRIRKKSTKVDYHGRTIKDWWKSIVEL